MLQHTKIANEAVLHIYNVQQRVIKTVVLIQYIFPKKTLKVKNQLQRSEKSIFLLQISCVSCYMI